MSEPKAPRVTHLLDDEADPGDASSLMRTALRGARADVPDAAHVEALSRSIAAAVGGGGGGGGGGGSEPGAGANAGAVGKAGATKLALGGVALMAAIGVGVLMMRGGGASTDASTSAGARPSTTSASAMAHASASAAARPSASAGREEEAVLDVHALPAAPVVVRDASRAKGTTAEGSPEAEMTLLRTAQLALGGAPAEALARCEEHAKTYPGGSLAEEREVIAVDALMRLGRRDEAEARATRFRDAHPGSAYLRRLETLLGRSD